MSSPPAIPTEIIDQILELFPYEDAATLKSCALVSIPWSTCAQRRIFSELHIGIYEGEERYKKMNARLPQHINSILRVLSRSPDRALSVKRLVIGTSHSTAGVIWTWPDGSYANTSFIHVFEADFTTILQSLKSLEALYINFQVNDVSQSSSVTDLPLFVPAVMEALSRLPCLTRLGLYWGGFGGKLDDMTKIFPIGSKIQELDLRHILFPSWSTEEYSITPVKQKTVLKSLTLADMYSEAHCETRMMDGFIGWLLSDGSCWDLSRLQVFKEPEPDDGPPMISPYRLSDVLRKSQHHLTSYHGNQPDAPLGELLPHGTLHELFIYRQTLSGYDPNPGPFPYLMSFLIHPAACSLTCLSLAVYAYKYARIAAGHASDEEYYLSPYMLELDCTIRDSQYLGNLKSLTVVLLRMGRNPSIADGQLEEWFPYSLEKGIKVQWRNRLLDD